MRRFTIITVVLVVSAAAWLGGIAAGPLSASAASPAPGAGSQLDVLSAVSCVSATDCMAAGSDTDTSGMNPAPLAEAWNGQGWRVLRTPPISGVLLGISCAGASACMAVGSRTSPDGSEVSPLAEAWDGHTWRVVRTAAPSGVLNLATVRCVSPAWCVAASGYGAAEPQLSAAIEMWNGTGWRRLASFGQASLNGVACRSRTDCIAVGSQSPASDSYLPFAVSWNGARWRMLPMPPGDTGNLSTSMSSVTCPTMTRCMALGSGSLLDAWTGHMWIQLTTPGVGDPLSISCAGASSCLAVGRTSGQGPVARVLLAERWTGRAWRALSPVRPGNQGSVNNAFFSLSCPAATTCVAVGSYGVGSLGGHTMAQEWNGSTWRLLTTPDPG